MNITAPITDYIPASLLTTRGDMVSRGVAIPERCVPLAAGSFLESQGVGAQPVFAYMDGILNTYVKGTGVGANYKHELLALRDTGVFIGNTTRNVGGDQVITGVGYESSAIVLMALDSIGANLNWSISFDNGVTRMCMYFFDNGVESSLINNQSMYIRRGAGNYLRGIVSAIGADGFTVTWTLVGACPLSWMYFCIP